MLILVAQIGIPIKRIGKLITINLFYFQCYKYENISINPKLMIDELLGQIPGS